MEKKEFRAAAKELGKVVSDIEVIKEKKNPWTKYIIKAADILSSANKTLKLGTQKTYTFHCSTMEDILKGWGKKD